MKLHALVLSAFVLQSVRLLGTPWTMASCSLLIAYSKFIPCLWMYQRLLLVITIILIVPDFGCDSNKPS